MLKDMGICMTLGVIGHLFVSPTPDVGMLIHNVLYWALIGLLLQVLLYIMSHLLGFGHLVYRECLSLWSQAEGVLFTRRSHSVRIKIS